MGRVIVSDFNINKQVRTIYYTDIIGLAGYAGTAAVQTESAIMAIRVVNSLVPMVFALLAALCFWQITVEDGIGEIQEELKAQGLRN